MTLLLTIGLGLVGYFLLSLLLLGAWTAYCEWTLKRNRKLNERLAFDRHVDHELREHMRVVGGNRILSDERWSA